MSAADVADEVHVMSRGGADARGLGAVVALGASLASPQAWAAGSGGFLAAFGVALLAGIITWFAQVLFMMVAVSAPERQPAVWMRVFAVANMLLGGFVVVFFVSTTETLRTASDMMIPLLGVGGVAFGLFGLWWRRGAPAS